VKKAIAKRLTPKQRRELKALAELAERDIDTRSIPEIRDWSGAKRGLFFRTVKAYPGDS
jgi:hypothetical protein